MLRTTLIVPAATDGVFSTGHLDLHACMKKRGTLKKKKEKYKDFHEISPAIVKDAIRSK